VALQPGRTARGGSPDRGLRLRRAAAPRRPDRRRRVHRAGRAPAPAATIAEADLVLLRTGWAEHRSVDPARYATDGPLLAPAAARWLIDEHPRLRAIATDAISIGSPRFPEASVATHHALTGVGRDDRRYVLIYEDVALPPGLDRVARVFAWPLFVEGSDGSPVTIVAERDPG
jgi:kynurenine formamidase